MSLHLVLSSNSTHAYYVVTCSADKHSCNGGYEFSKMFLFKAKSAQLLWNAVY